MQSLIAPDTIKANKLLQFARYEFDLSELYARKCVKKSTSRKESFLMLAFKGTIRPNSKNLSKNAMASKTTNLGLDTATYCAAY
jgi:hypothetical protein